MKRYFTLLFAIYLWISPLTAQDLFYKQFRGKVGDKTIRAELIKAPSQDNAQFNLRGSYYYERIGKTIKLTNGNIDALGNVFIEEGVNQADAYNRNQRVFVKTGSFTGTYYPDNQRVEGTWVSANGQRSLPFYLEEDYSNGSLSANLIFNDLTYESASIRFHYLVFMGKPGADQINRFVQQELLGNMQMQINDFIRGYQEAKSLGGAVDYYESSHICYVRLNEHDLLCLEYATNEYTGGAHGNYGSNYQVFNSQTGQKLKLNDLLRPGYEQALTQKAEQTLRRNYGIGSQESLSEFGFSLPQGKFALNENFYVNRSGLGFYYNTYEIAPYAVGPQDIFIPFSEIKHLIKTDGLLMPFVN